MRETVIDTILECRLIAILRNVASRDILRLGEALLAGGLRAMEVTFDPSQPEKDSETLRSIELLQKNFGGHAAVGAGTVLCVENVRRTAEVGGQFIISPHAEEAVIRETRALGLVSIPGCLTPSECVAAHNWGADFIKLFPLGELEPGYLKALRAPLSHLRFLGVGGMSLENIPTFRKAGALGFGIGGSLVNRDWIAAGEYGKITESARDYVNAVHMSLPD